MPQRESGFVYLWALFSVVLAGVVMAGVGQVWQAKAQREKEAELLYVGEQFRKAIMSYYNTGTKQFPETLEELLEDKRTPAIKRHLRKIYMDPITNTAEWGIIDEPPPGGNTVSGNSPAASQNTTPGNNAVAGGNQASSSNQPSGNSLMPNTGQTSGSTTPNQASNNAAPSSSPGIGSNLTKRITGVYSLSEKKPIKKDKFPEQYAKFSEALTYRDWKFIYKPGEGSSASKPASTQSRPNTAPGASPSNSPFAPQSSSGAASPSSRSSSAGNASPFAPQSGAPASSSGFGMD
ncbi:hypothetical protein R2103_12930 [Nitrosomonas sp. Is24]|uniref:hypothetical protein n=1 Tax=Nitrosomonas sp. Is24 TaxID=3080533 RepID=UPI00294B63EF|nr:hypothetical protein [Nitrosomonas sp. Is24]MDV6342673.1 hypothetical protein [Nitrosomonas sp. Is24]